MSCPAALRGKAPGPPSALTLPDVPGKQLSMVGLAICDSQYSEQKFLMGMMWMEQFSAQLLQFIQGDKPVLKKEEMRHGSDVSSF